MDADLILSDQPESQAITLIGPVCSEPMVGINPQPWVCVGVKGTFWFTSKDGIPTKGTITIPVIVQGLEASRKARLALKRNVCIHAQGSLVDLGVLTDSRMHGLGLLLNSLKRIGVLP